jgi:hypothetical protein
VHSNEGKHGSHGKLEEQPESEAAPEAQPQSEIVPEQSPKSEPKRVPCSNQMARDIR